MKRNPLTLTHCGRPGLTIEAAQKGDGWAWHVQVGVVQVSGEGLVDEAAAMAAGRNCARQLLGQWIELLAD